LIARGEIVEMEVVRVMVMWISDFKMGSSDMEIGVSAGKMVDGNVGV
jgi:hypothetical protein